MLRDIYCSTVRGVVVFLIIIILYVVPYAPVQGCQAPRADVGDILLRVDSRKMSWSEARERLGAFSNDELVREVARVLREGPLIEDEEARIFAYLQFVDRGAVSTDVGYTELVRGLEDPVVSDICAKGLLDAPADKQDEIVLFVTEFLRTTKDFPRDKIGPGLVGVIHAIPHEAPRARKFVDALGEVLGKDGIGEQVRWAAARVILRTDGLKGAVEVMGDVSPAGKAVILMTFIKYFNDNEREERELSREDAKQRPKIKELVIEAMRHKDFEVRKAARIALTFVFGTGAYVIRSEDDFELDPQYREALEHMADHDPAPELRKSGAFGLDPSLNTKRVGKILRNRSRVRQESDK